MSQQLGALQTHTGDTFLFISHTMNVLLFKFRCNIFNAGFGSEWDTLYYPPTYAWVFQVFFSPQVSPPKPCIHLSSPLRATCPAHLILLDLITRTRFGEQYRPLGSSLCSFLHSPVTSSLLGPNTHLNTLFSNAISLRSSLNASDQVSHPHKTKRQNYSTVYLNLYIFG